MVKKIILVVVFIALAAAAGSIWGGRRLPAETPPTTPAPSATPLPANEIELEVLPEVEECPTCNLPPSAEETFPTDEELIREAMAERHGKSVAEVALTVGENTGTHAIGVVSFAGEMGGGWWLAAKVADNWEIAADGNGTVPCDAIEPYDFPTDIVPECWDEVAGELVTR